MNLEPSKSYHTFYFVKWFTILITFFKTTPCSLLIAYFSRLQMPVTPHMTPSWTPSQTWYPNSPFSRKDSEKPSERRKKDLTKMGEILANGFINHSLAISLDYHNFMFVFNKGSCIGHEFMVITKWFTFCFCKRIRLRIILKIVILKFCCSLKLHFHCQ